MGEKHIHNFPSYLLSFHPLLSKVVSTVVLKVWGGDPWGVGLLRPFQKVGWYNNHLHDNTKMSLSLLTLTLSSVRWSFLEAVMCDITEDQNTEAGKRY